MLDVKFIRIESIDVIVKLIGLHEIKYAYLIYLKIGRIQRNCIIDFIPKKFFTVAHPLKRVNENNIISKCLRIILPLM